MSFIESHGWRTDDLASLDEDARPFATEFTSDILFTLDCPKQRLLRQLIHVTGQLLCRGEETIGDMIVSMNRNVFELDTNGEVIDKFINYANKILLLRIIPGINYTVAVRLDASSGIVFIPRLVSTYHTC